MVFMQHKFKEWASNTEMNGFQFSRLVARLFVTIQWKVSQYSEQVIRALGCYNSADSKLCVRWAIVNPWHKRVQLDLVWYFCLVSQQFYLGYFHWSLKLDYKLLRKDAKTLTVPAY